MCNVLEPGILLLLKLNRMKPLYGPTAAVFSIFFGLALLDANISKKESSPEPVKSVTAIAGDPKIQAAILLDVSGSMDGLIEQAKAQLWNMVSVMGRVKCEKGNPRIEIALYEYGRANNDEKKGYIKQISPFTSDLDKLSQELFSLRTNGGDEYCGQVIYTSLDELTWDQTNSNYKVIFIAGNEDFRQGNVSWAVACAKAKEKGVIVNTIYCGRKEQGIRENWNLIGECGNGSFTNIDHNARQEDIFTPYDTTLITLNGKLNGTYLFYGSGGESSFARQAAMDKENGKIRNEVAMKRISVKGQASMYNNANWDLLDALAADSTIIQKVDMKSLPDSLSKLSREDLRKVVEKKSSERLAVQKQIVEVSNQREKYIAAEKAKKAGVNQATLETEVEKVIREQVKRYNMMVE